MNRDIITCHKELERGDKLMSLFWEIVAASGARASPEKSKSVSCDESDHGSRKSNEDAITSAGTPDNVQFREEVSGVLGDKLSTEAAEECLRLLVEATEAYEGQGFETQAGHAIRWDVLDRDGEVHVRSSGQAGHVAGTLTIGSTCGLSKLTEEFGIYQCQELSVRQVIQFLFATTL